jgi:hypothetical protein
MKIGFMLGIAFAMTLMTSPPACLYWTALGDIGIGTAYAQENQSFSRIAELVVQKGYKNTTFGNLCDLFHIKAYCQGYQINSLIDANEIKKSGVQMQIGWVTSFNVVVEQAGSMRRIILADHDKSIGYAFSVSTDDAFQAAATGENLTGDDQKTLSGKDQNWRWKSAAITNDLKQKFSLEKSYWLANLKDIEEMPPLKD